MPDANNSMKPSGLHVLSEEEAKQMEANISDGYFVRASGRYDSSAQQNAPVQPLSPEQEHFLVEDAKRRRLEKLKEDCEVFIRKQSARMPSESPVVWLTLTSEEKVPVARAHVVTIHPETMITTKVMLSVGWAIPNVKGTVSEVARLVWGVEPPKASP